MNKSQILGFFFSLVLFSCTDPDLIGLEIQPESDQIVISTNSHEGGFFAELSSVIEDSVRTDENSLNLLGSYNDPVFGESKASFSTQLLLSESAIDFGDNPVLVSAELSLTYAGYYGDSTQQMEIEVAKLDQSIYVDSAYYSNNILEATEIIATHSFYPYGSDPDTLGKYTLKVNLYNLGQEILNASSEDLTDNNSFIEYLKGIQIRTTSIGGSIIYFNLKDVDSKLTITYNDSLQLDLVMSSSAARINHFEHAQQLTNELGVQSMGGYNLKVVFSDTFVDSLQLLLAEKPINAAYLTFNQINETSDYSAHSDLSLVRVNADGTKVFMEDFFEGETHFGGALGDSRYTFNISKHLSMLMNNQLPVEDLHLIPTGASINANRTLFAENVELRIIFTDF